MGKIDFVSFIGVHCPVCGAEGCYRQMTSYWRDAIELFPEFRRGRIPVARFLCRRHRRSFSLLPIQLIPYYRYTVSAVVGTLLLGMICWQRGRRGFYGASLGVDPESLVTPWLVACWLRIVVRGFRGAHSVLRGFYRLQAIRSSNREDWGELRDYFLGFYLRLDGRWYFLLMELVGSYARQTGRFLFGTASQYRHAVC